MPPEPGLTKRSVILFAAGASDPAQSALGSIKFLAGDLNSSMTGAGSRIQLLAYGGEKGDKGSDARRLSLKRALAIRQVLIDSGVPAERIDVRAMGGADDGGPTDRVDRRKNLNRKKRFRQSGWGTAASVPSRRFGLRARMP